MLEYCRQSLCSVFHWPNNDMEKLKHYAHEMVKAVMACHKANIAHLDIKPANFVIDDYERVKLCDFGLSVECYNEEVCQQFAGTHPFIAPEVLLMKPYDPFKADIFSLGVTLFMLYTGRLPWEGANFQHISMNMMKTPPQINLIQDKEMASVITSCLNFDPKQRPTIDQIMNSPVFRDSLTKSMNRFQNRANFNHNDKKIASGCSMIVRPRIIRNKIVMID